MPNPGRLLSGQLFDLEKNLIRQYTQREMPKDTADALLGSARTEITPTDRDSSEVKVWDDITNAVLNMTDSFGTYENLNAHLPAVLQEVTVTYNESKGEGNYTEDAVGSSGGSSSSSLTFNLNGSAQSSFSIIADVSVKIKQPFYSNVRATNYLFYLASDPTHANVIVRLAQPPFNLTVNHWPRFRPETHTLTIKGQSMDIRVNAKIDQSAGASSGNSFFVKTQGRGFSLSGSVNMRTIEIPPTIHSYVPIDNTERTGQASASSTVNITGGLNFPGAVETITKTTPVQRATVFPSHFNPTGGSGDAFTIPTTGLYLFNIISQKDVMDLNKVQATVIDFSLI